MSRPLTIEYEENDKEQAVRWCRIRALIICSLKRIIFLPYSEQSEGKYRGSGVHLQGRS
jgi:hypothetical protein